MKPEDIHPKFAAAFNAGDIEALMALFEPEATLIPTPGQAATGLDAIRQALSSFLATRPNITVETRQVLLGGDIALLYSRWVLSGAMELAGLGNEVARRQPDGRWLYVVDNPFAGE